MSVAMNSKEEECHQRGDSDDEIAELRFQALLTKRENEAEVSPAREPCPFNDNDHKVSINQPLSNFRGQLQYNFRGRGRGPYYKPYLQTFSQQIASQSVNSSNIVVLTSSEPEAERRSCQPPPDWIPGRGGFRGWGGRWPRGGRGLAPSHRNPGVGTQQSAPPLVLPQDKYANQAKDSKDHNEQNKAKLSARMRRLQGSDSDSEDSESDSSDDSSSSDSSSDSNSSSSDSSSSDSDSDSESNQDTSSKKSDKIIIKKDKSKLKGEVPQHAPKAVNSECVQDSNGSSSNVLYPTNLQSKPKSPVKVAAGPPPQIQSSGEHKKSTFSPPPSRKGSSRSPSFREKHSSPPPRHFRSRSPSFKSKRSSRSPQDSYSHRAKLSPRKRKSSSFSPRRYSSSRHSRTPIRRYGSRSPYHTHKGKSPIRHSPYGRYSKSPIPKKFSKSPPGRFRSRSKSPYLSKRYRSRSPFLRKSRSPFPRKLSRSPLPRKLSRSPLPLRRSRSPLPVRLKSRSPFSSKRYVSRSPKPVKRYSSITPPPLSKPYNSRSPYGGRRYGSPSPRSYPRRSSSFSPKRYRASPRSTRPLYKDYRSKSPRPLSQGSPRRGKSISPPLHRYGSRSPLRGRALSHEKRPFRKSRTPSPRRIKRIGSVTPPPFSPRDKFAHGRPRSPFKRFGSRSPLGARYDPPTRIGLSPPKLPRHHLEGPDHLTNRGQLRSPPYNRNFSPRGHNYPSRSPSPYFRGRRTPPGDNLLIPERGPPIPIPKSPIYYGSRPDMFSGRGNTADAYEMSHHPLPKRYPMPNPNEQHVQWPAHKPELPPPHKPLLSHYPPKFPPMEASYGNQGDFLPPCGQQLPEKVWPPNAPPNRNFGENFGPPHLNQRIHPRSERFAPNGPQFVGGGGRGRGPRGQRGHSMRGVHLRLGGRGSWSGPPQQSGPPGAHELPAFGEPYMREKPGRLGPPNLMKRPPPLYEAGPLLPPPLMHKAISPGPQRIPRGPKTPPYSPNREPSPLEWQKRGQISLKNRTPSLSPSPSPGYDNEPHPLRQLNQSNKTMRDRDGRIMDSFEGPSNPRQGRYNTHKYPYDPPHSFKSDQRGDIREVDERRKVLKNEEHKEKDIGFRKMHSSGRGRSVETDNRAPKREHEREVENKHRSPQKSKSSNESRSQPDYKEDSRTIRSQSNLKEDSRSTRSQSDYKEDSRSIRSQSNYKEDARGNKSQPDYKEDSRSSRSQSNYKEDTRGNKSQPDYKEDSRSSRSQSNYKDDSRGSKSQPDYKEDSRSIRSQSNYKDDSRGNKSQPDNKEDSRNIRSQSNYKEDSRSNKSQPDYKEDSRSSRPQSDYKEESHNRTKKERVVEPDSKDRREKEIEDIKREKEEREEKRVSERDADIEQKMRSNETKLKREKEREPEKKETRDSKTKGELYEGSSEKNSDKDRNDLDRKREGSGSSTKRLLKEPRMASEQTMLEERKPTKGGSDLIKKKKELDTKTKKEELSDDGSKKKDKKRKKKHKEEDKSSKSSKKKKKEKKKKKVSKKKVKKGSRDSDYEGNSKTKKKLHEDSRNDSRERDLRQMLTKRDESPRDGSLKRRMDPLDSVEKMDDRKKRREDMKETSKDWKLSSREKPPRLDRGDGGVEEYRRRDDRVPFREKDRRLVDKRSRPEDGKKGNKGLMVTVGSGASNRQVTSGNGPNNFKGNSKKEMSRIPVHLRLGQGSADNASDDSSGPKVPKKGRQLNDGRRRPYAGNNVTGLRRPGSKGSRGNDR